MIELIFYEHLNFWRTTKKQWGTHSYVFLHILKEKKHDDLFSKSKKSLLRNTKSDKLYIFVRRAMDHTSGIC